MLMSQLGTKADLPDLKCEVDDCPNPKQPWPASKEYKQHCPQRACSHTSNWSSTDECLDMVCAVPTCKSKTEEDSIHCSKHTCLDRNCDNPSGAYRYCDKRRCPYCLEG